jgi:hypothetical protein
MSSPNIKFSIVIPYLSSSKTIAKCKHFLEKYTTNEYELVEIVDSTDVYDAFNSGVYAATSDKVILLNDDMYVSPGWDELYIKYHEPNLILTGFLVEPGFVPVASENICENFGMDPDSFDEDGFVSFAKQFSENDEITYDAKGWFMPIMFNKNTFIPYPNEIKYPYPNDITLIKEILPANNFKFAQVNSIVYHLQNFSNRS